MTATTGGRTHGMVIRFRGQLGVPALGVSVVDADGVVERFVLGSRRRDDTDPVTVDDQWHIGSCGKAITAALYARLVERGDAAWGVPLRELLGDLAGDIHPEWATPTIDEALVCQAGIRANLSRDGMRRAYADRCPATEQRSAAVRSTLAEPPRNRGRFRYSNLSYVVIGAVIDRVAGMPFEDALATLLLDPLGITSAGVGPPPLVWGHHPRAQVGSLVVGRGAPADPRSASADNPSVLTPAGRLHLSLADWGAFQRIFLTGGGDLLAPASVERLLTGPPGAAPGMTMGWAPAREADLSFGQQGSNGLWSATALVDADRRRTAMVVVNDGRTRVLVRSARLAAALLRAR